MKLITEKKWNSIADFNKYVNKDGDHFITKLDPEKGTCLIPVAIITNDPYKLVLGKNQNKALWTYESGHDMWYDRGYYWDNSTTIMIYNKKLAYHEIENAVDIAKNNFECECCDNAEDFMNMESCKKYAWEYKALERLLKRI